MKHVMSPGLLVLSVITRSRNHDYFLSFSLRNIALHIQLLQLYKALHALPIHSAIESHFPPLTQYICIMSNINWNRLKAWHPLLLPIMLMLCICNEPALEQLGLVTWGWGTTKPPPSLLVPVLLCPPPRWLHHCGRCCKKQFADNFQCFNQTGLT